MYEIATFFLTFLGVPHKSRGPSWGDIIGPSWGVDWHELIGIPNQLIIGKRDLNYKLIELKDRLNNDSKK